MSDTTNTITDALNASDATASTDRAAANDAAIAAQHARMAAAGNDAASISALAGTPSLDPVPRQPEHTATPSFKGFDLSVPGRK